MRSIIDSSNFGFNASTCRGHYYRCTQFPPQIHHLVFLTLAFKLNDSASLSLSSSDSAGSSPGARFSKLPAVITSPLSCFVFHSRGSCKRFENCTVKLSAKETKWTSSKLRTHPTFLETLILKSVSGSLSYRDFRETGPRRISWFKLKRLHTTFEKKTTKKISTASIAFTLFHSIAKSLFYDNCTILAPSLANFYCQYVDRHMNL